MSLGKYKMQSLGDKLRERERLEVETVSSEKEVENEEKVKKGRRLNK